MTHRDILIDKLKQGLIFKIVFLGDSITSAEWVHPNCRKIIEYVLKQELAKDLGDWKLPSWGIRCINSGFDGYFVSYEQGYSKPNIGAYENFLHKSNLRAEECVFIDDKEENIKGAEKVGMIAIRYEGRENLIRELSALGVI